MKKQSFEDQDFELWVLLHQTRDAIFRARDKELGQYGISTMQAGVLFIINAIGNEATPTEVARWLFREPHTVSSLLNRMERDGLVSKTKDLQKKNMVRVTLTEKGRSAYNESLKRKSINKVMTSLSEEERLQFRSYLEKLRDRALTEPGREMKLPFP